FLQIEIDRAGNMIPLVSPPSRFGVVERKPAVGHNEIVPAQMTGKPRHAHQIAHPVKGLPYLSLLCHRRTPPRQTSFKLNFSNGLQTPWRLVDGLQIGRAS